MQRTRTVTWHDPVESARSVGAMDGIDFLQAIAGSRIPPPPFAVLLGLQAEDFSPGVAVFTVEPAEYHYNPIGTVHGGLAATLCDSAMGCAVQTTLPAGTAYTTLELKVNFVRPITRETGRLRCEGRVIHMGRRTATAEAKVSDADGKLYAHATSTLLVQP